MAKMYTNKGLSLAEFLVSFAVLVLVVGGVLFSFVRCLEFIDLSKDMSRAVQAAQSQMEDVRATPFNDIMSNFDGTVFNGIPDLNGAGSVKVTSIATDLLEVVVEVAWKNSKGKAYGEDENINGVLDAGEDLNGNNRLDSPVELSMRIFKR